MPTSEPGSSGIGCTSPALLLKREAGAVQSHPADTGTRELPPIAQHLAPIKPGTLHHTQLTLTACPLTRDALAKGQDTRCALHPISPFLILFSPLGDLHR